MYKGQGGLGDSVEHKNLVKAYARGCEPACRRPKSVKPVWLEEDNVGGPIIVPGVRPFYNEDDMHNFFLGNYCGDKLSVMDQRMIFVAYQPTDNIRYIHRIGGVLPPYHDYADNRSMVDDPVTGYSPSTLFRRKYTETEFISIQDECETHIFFSMFGCSKEDYRTRSVADWVLNALTSFNREIQHSNSACDRSLIRSVKVYPVASLAVASTLLLPQRLLVPM